MYTVHMKGMCTALVNDVHCRHKGYVYSFKLMVYIVYMKGIIYNIKLMVYTVHMKGMCTALS